MVLGNGRSWNHQDPCQRFNWYGRFVLQRESAANVRESLTLKSGRVLGAAAVAAPARRIAMTTTPTTMRPLRIFSTHAWSMEHPMISVALEMLARQILVMRLMRLAPWKRRRFGRRDFASSPTYWDFESNLRAARHSTFLGKRIRGYHHYLRISLREWPRARGYGAC